MAGRTAWAASRPTATGSPTARRARTTPSGYVPGGPASGGTDGWYDCDDLVNDSIRNTGLTVLPHKTGTGMDAGKVRGANLWYSRGNPNSANGCPEFPRERGVDNAPNYGATPRQLCPYATANGATIMNGPVYRYDDEAGDTSVRWPRVLGRALVPAQPRRLEHQARAAARSGHRPGRGATRVRRQPA